MKVGDLVQLYKVRSVGGVSKDDVGVVLEVNKIPPDHTTWLTGRQGENIICKVQWVTLGMTRDVNAWILRKIE